MNARARCTLLLMTVWGISMGAIGCGAVPSLPATFDVATTAAEKTEVEAGTGPAGFANSTWSLSRKGDPGDTAADVDAPTPPGPYGGILSGQGLERPPVGEQIFLVHFGAQGEMTEVTENRFFLANIYGATIPVGGEWAGTTLPGVAFRSNSYGLQVGDRFGLAIVVNVRFGNLYLGQAVLYSWGTITGDAISGQFGYLLDFTDGVASVLDIVADQYPVEGLRVEP